MRGGHLVDKKSVNILNNKERAREILLYLFCVIQEFGNVLLSKGVNIQVVAKLMGHKDTGMLIKIYAHLLEETRIKQFDEIKKFLN